MLDKEHGSDVKYMAPALGSMVAGVGVGLLAWRAPAFREAARTMGVGAGAVAALPCLIGMGLIQNHQV